MRRFLIPLAGVAAAAVLGACSDSHISQCFESGATAYDVFANGDTSKIFHWLPADMPVRVYAEATDSLPQNVVRGMQLWVGAFRCNEVTLQLWTDSSTADIVFRNPSSLPSPPASAHFAASDSVGACFGRTDVAPLDAQGRLVRPIRSYVAPNGIDTAATNACYHFVTAHELGHALGLFAHSADPADLMYSTPRHTALSLDDKFTIQLLYHFDAPIKPVPR
jgi:predicted Zn-dependent protease